ncbi:MAG: methionine--tRNA ligase subunit beta, partial [Terracidiphilus sp.]
ARVLATAAEAIRIVTALVYPILPESAAKVWRQLDQGEIAEAAHNAFLTNLAWGGLAAGTHFAEPAPLFPRAEKDAIERMTNLEAENNKSVIEAAGAANGSEAAAKPDAAKAPVAAVKAPEAAPSFAASVPQTAGPSAPEAGTEGNTPTASAAQWPTTSQTATTDTTPAGLEHSAPALEAAEPPLASPQVTIDDFAKVELRVAQILVAERVPKADKLLRLEVDLGYEKRQILAGIAQYYEPEKLIGRKIVIVANLAPRKMRGLESNGMLLAASLEGGAPVLAGFLEDVPLGARLK